MIIFGIDPGPVESAYLVFEDINFEDSKFDFEKRTFQSFLKERLENSKINLFEYAKIENEALLIQIQKIIDYYFDEDIIFAIEGIVNYGMPVGNNTIRTITYYGRLYQFLLARGVKKEDIYIVSRQEVKKHHCGGATVAKDGNIRQALIDKYGEPGTQKNVGFTYGIVNDMWSAFGIATYIYESIIQGKEILNIYSHG